MREELFLLIRSIIEGTFNVSDLSVADLSLLSSLESDGLVSFSDGSYVVSDQGMALMAPYKVSNAIIMAAGFGSRFIPYTYTQPKGLLEVNGEVLIERQIEQLLSVGVENIVIVVGYLKSSFSYLVEKYGVSLVENFDYASKNNISSLYYVGEAGLLGNSYVLTSDIRMSLNVYHAYEYVSWYALKCISGSTDEWPVVLDESSRIVGLSSSGGDCLCLYGPAYFSASFSDLMVEKIGSIYSDPSKSDYYWENVLSEHISEFEMVGNIFSSGVVEEFECFEELIVYDASYNTFPRNDVIETICRVLSVSPIEIKSIESLKVGMTNDSFSFMVGDTKYVYRMPGEGTELLINRYNEAQVYEAIKFMNLSDEIVYLSPDDGTKISKFIADSKMVDTSYLSQTIKVLKSLHTSGIVVDHSFDILERVAYYKSLCEGVNARYYDGYETVYEEMGVLMSYIESNPIEYVFCHIDGIVTNFLDTDSGLRLLDWEYAGMSDPFMDLAMNVLFSYLSEEETDALLEDYLERKPSLPEYKRYYALISLTGMLWALWTVYKEALGDHFGTYGQEQFDYGKLYLQRFNLLGENQNETR